MIAYIGILILIYILVACWFAAITGYKGGDEEVPQFWTFYIALMCTLWPITLVALLIALTWKEK